MFPREATEKVVGTRVSPILYPRSGTAEVSVSNAATEVTESSAVPESKIGHVLRNVVRRVLYLHGTAVANAPSTPPRILLAKMDTKSVFSQVSVAVKESPKFSMCSRTL